MITINLLVNGQTARRTVRPLLRGVSLAATCLALGLYGWHVSASRATLLARSAAADAELAALTSAAKRLDAARKRQAELVADLAATRRILDDRSASTELFEAISRSLTDGLWLTEVKRSAAAVQLEGRASSLAAVSGLVRSLGENLTFARPLEIRSVSTDDLEHSPVLRFQVAGELALAAAEGRR